MIPLNLGNRNLTRLSDTPRLVIQVFLQQLQTLQRAERSEGFRRFVSYHFSLEFVGVDEDGFQMRDGGWTSDLTEDVGELMLQER